MKNSIALFLFAAVAPPLLALACSSKGGGTGTGGEGGNTGTAGDGGNTGTAGDGGTGGSPTTSSTTSSTTDTSSTTTSTPPMGACSGAQDQMVLNDPNSTTTQDVAGCCLNVDPPTDPGLLGCILSFTGLSNDCAQCFSTWGQCILANCKAECGQDWTTQSCTDCAATSCTPALNDCAGL